MLSNQLHQHNKLMRNEMHLIEHSCVKVGRYIIPLVGHEYMKARNENKFIITGEDASNQQQRYNKLMRNEMHRIEHI